MIQLGLQRISRLLQNCHPVHFVHVAGTNGKGSICAYVAAALTATSIRTGKFSSPHLVHRHDCITINGNVVQRDLFDETEAEMEQLNWEEGIGATPFELLTATAFKIFDKKRCAAAVVECGMGGLNDATNAYNHGYKRVAVISKVGLDHQEFLGDTIEKITRDKCGIFTPKTPVIFDETNDAGVLRVIRQEADKADAYIRYPWHTSAFNTGPLPADFQPERVTEYLQSSSYIKTPWQLKNAEIAFRASYQLVDSLQHHLPGIGTLAYGDDSLRASLLPEQPNARLLLNAIAHTPVPGRFQTLDLTAFLGGLRGSIILDGAHNAQAIAALAPTLWQLRASADSPSGKLTWVLAFSEGKKLDEMLAPLLRPGDYVAATSFGPVAGMPWKRAMPSREIVDCLEGLQSLGLDVRVKDFGTDVGAALGWATSVLGVPTVATGSLYLVSDILRLVQSQETQSPNLQSASRQSTSRWSFI